MTGDVLADVAALAGRSSAKGSDRLIDDLGLDSLGLAELTALLEDYGIAVPTRLLDDPSLWWSATLSDLMTPG